MGISAGFCVHGRGADEDVLAHAPTEKIEPLLHFTGSERAEVSDDIEGASAERVSQFLDLTRVGDQ